MSKSSNSSTLSFTMRTNFSLSSLNSQQSSASITPLNWCSSSYFLSRSNLPASGFPFSSASHSTDLGTRCPQHWSLHTSLPNTFWVSETPSHLSRNKLTPSLPFSPPAKPPPHPHEPLSRIKSKTPPKNWPRRTPPLRPRLKKRAHVWSVTRSTEPKSHWLGCSHDQKCGAQNNYDVRDPSPRHNASETKSHEMKSVE